MPVHCPVTIKNLSSDEFEKLDYRVMGHAYASQNELGRLCDECAYEADLKARLLAEGFQPVHTQIPIKVAHRDFSKDYRLDLIAADALYELKTTSDFTREHEAQLLNYMFVLGIQRAKLLNFRPGKVQGRIVASGLTPEKRARFTFIMERWKDLTPACENLRQTLRGLLLDWGAFLELNLYQEALVHFLGGQTHIEHRVALNRNGLDLGTQRMYVHSPGVAFRLTAVTGDQPRIESHLHRLLALTNLEAIQWINLNHAQIELRTIKVNE